MSNNKVFILIDRSASMTDIWAKTIESVNAYINSIEDKNAEVLVAVFDSQTNYSSHSSKLSYDIVRNCKRSEMKHIKSTEFEPRGGTPLLDATARIMWSMMDSGADRAVLAIITDGDENESRNFRVNDIKEMTTILTTKYNYDVVFLGANFDRIKDVAAVNYGWKDNSRVLNLQPQNMVRGMAMAGATTTEYFATGHKKAEFYTQQEKDSLSS